MKALSLFFVIALGFSSVGWSNENKSVRIGFMAGLTGADPNTARELVRGVEAFKTHKGKALDGKIQIEILDSQGSPETTVSVMRKAYEQGIRLFVGLSSSNEAMAAAKFISTKPDAFFVTPFATNPRVTQISDRVFRTCFDDTAQGEFLADVTRKLNPKSVLIFENLESLYSQGLAESFRSKLSGVPHKTVRYLPAELEDPKFFDSLRNEKPDVVFIPDAAQTSAKVIKRFSLIQPKAHYLGGDGWGGNVLFHAILPKDHRLSLRYSTYWHSDIRSEFNSLFKAAYVKSTNGGVPTSGAALSFEALDIVFRSLEAIDFKWDATKLRQRIVTTTFDGTTGKLTFRNGGTPKRKVVLMRLDKDMNYRPEELE